MIGGQDQRVAEGSQAVQSGRDTNITQGISTEDMKQIIESLADQMPKFVAIASAMMEERLKSFKEEVIDRFEKDPSTNKEAFADPDFLHVLGDAQKGYARTGKADTHAVLLDLIAERSKQTTGTRRAFTINEAIEVAQKLSANELGELALSFLLRRTKRSPDTWNNISTYFAAVFREFLPYLETENVSYEYLVSQRCATLSIGEISLVGCLKSVYPALFIKGRPVEEYWTRFPEFNNRFDLFTASDFDQTGVRPNATSLEAWQDMCLQRGMSVTRAAEVWQIAMSHIASDAEASVRLDAEISLFNEVAAIWDKSYLRHLELTTIGVVVAHGRLSGWPTFGAADLGIWVR